MYYDLTDYNNLAIAYTNQTGSASTGWLLPQGVFKIEYKCCIDQGSYLNRLGCVVNVSFNGIFHLAARSFANGRDANNIDQQTMSTEFIYTIPAGGQYT